MSSPWVPFEAVTRECISGFGCSAVLGREGSFLDLIPTIMSPLGLGRQEPSFMLEYLASASFRFAACLLEIPVSRAWVSRTGGYYCTSVNAILLSRPGVAFVTLHQMSHSSSPALCYFQKAVLFLYMANKYLNIRYWLFLCL